MYTAIQLYSYTYIHIYIYTYIHLYSYKSIHIYRYTYIHISSYRYSYRKSYRYSYSYRYRYIYRCIFGFIFFPDKPSESFFDFFVVVFQIWILRRVIGYFPEISASQKILSLNWKAQFPFPPHNSLGNPISV